MVPCHSFHKGVNFCGEGGFSLCNTVVLKLYCKSHSVL